MNTTDRPPSRDRPSKSYPWGVVFLPPPGTAAGTASNQWFRTKRQARAHLKHTNIHVSYLGLAEWGGR